MTARHPALLWIACASFLPVARAQFVQQGNKLVGTDGVGATQGDGGRAVALSADGNTAIVGAFGDYAPGAVWVFTRSAGAWSQQGGKLVGSGAVGSAGQGIAVALSADGNTAIVGGFLDNGSVGAAWVFTRAGGIWTQQGAKLVGTGAVGVASQGISVALSADGNTALVGGLSDNNSAGAVWVWARSGGVWTQQGSKLVGSGASGAAAQGVTVAISGDGRTALVGGIIDGGQFTGLGAVWVWTQSGGVWTQQGNKLVAPTTIAIPQEGDSLGLSSDGNTAIIGSRVGFWVWTRSAGVWTSQAGPLVGSGLEGGSAQGVVALSGDGNTAVSGNATDSGGKGAIWVWQRSGAVWTQLGTKLVGTGSSLAPRFYDTQGSSVAISADGNTILEAGSGDNMNTGATWVFVRQAAVPGTPAPSTILLTLTGLAALALLFRSFSRVT